jgi:D-alanyl-lipoteichoic acid acyltransferase DltB (MBOAT superfamily)
MAFVPKYILILFGTIIINYAAGFFIEKVNPYTKKNILLACIFANVLVLGFFKYFNFFIENINILGEAINWNYSIPFLQIILPIGLSFHTFQALSYVIEVYRGKQQAERHFGIYALYVMYYPQLVAGPIERPQNLLHQFHKEQIFDAGNVTEGLKRMAWGFFKKTVIADHLALIVNAVYANPQGFDGPTLIMATLFFAIQLYCDFSGYSDIALGASRVMGITLMENFERPYFSKSIAEFWRRWHISLSTWLRDYVYYPLALGTKRPTRTKLYLATFVTFLLSGLWHGAAWNYVVMGAYFGGCIILAEVIKKHRLHLFRVLYVNTQSKLFLVFEMFFTCILVCIGWVFFRASALSDAFYILGHFWSGMFTFISHSYSYYTWKNLFSLNGLIQKQDFLVAFFGVCVLLGVDLVERKISFWAKLAEFPSWIRWGVYYCVIFSILAFGIFGAQDFIYFQF